jgi:hypothetical protein
VLLCRLATLLSAQLVAPSQRPWAMGARSGHSCHGVAGAFAPHKREGRWGRACAAVALPKRAASIRSCQSCCVHPYLSMCKGPSATVTTPGMRHQDCHRQDRRPWDVGAYSGLGPAT